MNLPCDNPCIKCPPGIGGGVGPIDPDNPFVNLSSEDPDALEYIGRNFYSDGRPPPLQSVWTKDGCFGLCISTVSQCDADTCALQRAVECLVTNPLFPCTTCVPPVPQPRTVYTNTPQSCAFACPDGTPFVFTVAAGRFSDVSQLAANQQAYTYACNQTANNRVCLGMLSPVRTCSNALYSGSVVCSSANTPITFTIIGELPDGILMSQNETTAFFDGSPTIPGNYSWTVVATDSFGNKAERLVTLDIFGVATVALADGVVNEVYSETLQYAGTAGGTVVWSITMGTLPDGLTLNSSTGEISGTPTTEETQTLQVTVTDGILTCNRSLGIQIAAASDCPDWANLLWGTATVDQVGGVAFFAPQNAISDTFASNCSIDNVPGSFVGTDNTGAIPYNGPGCNCNLQFDISYIPSPAADPNDTVQYQIVSALFGLIATAGLGSVTGIVDIPFSLQDTLGADDTITVRVIGSIANNFGGEPARSQIFSGNVSNV